MKIPANSFGLDMNAMLNEMNGKRIHDYYDRVINDSSNHIKAIQNRIDKAVKQGKANTQWMGREINQQITDYRAANEQMWNHAMPPEVNKQFNMSLVQAPKNTDYYYPPGPNNFPDNPEPGDVCWQGNWDDIGSNDVEAQMYVYYKGENWKPVKSMAQMTGVNINGANIHGGMITGAMFRSNQQGMNGAPFWVNRDGTVYAQNFIADLQHSSSRDGQEVNNCVYDGFHRFNGDDQPWGGFTLHNGLLTERAGVTQLSGNYIWSDHKYNNARVAGNTYLEPGYLKLRYSRDDTSNKNMVRTDLRAGNLEISGNWGQNTGIRLGYWNTTGPHIAMGDWDAHISGADLSLTGGNGNIGIHQPLIAHNGIKADSLIVKGGFRVNNKTLADSSDISRLDSRISTNAGNIDTNAGTISNHGTIINGDGGYLFPNNIINGNSNGSSHSKRLDSHNGQLMTHQQEIDQITQNTQNLKDQMDEWSGFIDQVNTWKAGGGIQISGISIYENRIYGNTASQQVLFHNHWGQTVDIRAGDIYSQGHKIASDRSLKKDVTPVDSKDALSKVLNTDILRWRYKSDKPSVKKKIGPIIDDYNEDNDQKYYTPDDLIKTTKEGDAFSLNSAISFLFLSVQELQKQNSQLSQRLARIEFNNK